MIRTSTTVTHGYTVPNDGAGMAVSYLLPLKSRFTGDPCAISSFQFRALLSGPGNILSGGGAHTLASSSVVTIVPKRRPALMHQRGVLVSNGTTGIPFGLMAGSQTETGTVTLLIAPSTGTIRIARGALTVDISSTGAFTFTGAQAVYINGTAITTGTTVPFPFPRLVTIAYTARTTEHVTVGSSTGTAVFWLQQVAITQKLMDATEVANHARAYYRKPSVSTVFTDSAISSVPSDNAVTVPEVWREV
jgi:hypothetical protein